MIVLYGVVSVVAVLLVLAINVMAIQINRRGRARHIEAMRQRNDEYEAMCKRHVADLERLARAFQYRRPEGPRAN